MIRIKEKDGEITYKLNENTSIFNLVTKELNLTIN
jgi:hypothetical protein